MADRSVKIKTHSSDPFSEQPATIQKQNEILEAVGPTGFQANDFDDTTTANVTYVGKQNAAGEWWIVRIDESGSTTTFQHATFTNNPLVSPNTYSQAWSEILTLTYGDYDDVF